MLNYLVLKPRSMAGMTEGQGICHRLPQAKKPKQEWTDMGPHSTDCVPAIWTIGVLGVGRVRAWILTALTN